jgi:hypothetical protein
MENSGNPRVRQFDELLQLDQLLQLVGEETIQGAADCAFGFNELQS